MPRKYSYIHTFCINTATESIEFYIYPLGLFSVIMQVLVWQQYPFSFQTPALIWFSGNTEASSFFLFRTEVVLTLQMQ